MFLFSFIKSFVLYPPHYDWAAFQRPGICLSYHFGFGVLFAIAALMFSPTSLEAYFAQEIQNLALPPEINEKILSMFGQTKYLFYPIILGITGLAYAMAMLNLCILATIFVAQPINFSTQWLGSLLSFDQILRIVSYSISAALAFSIFAATSLGWGMPAIGAVFLFYIAAPTLYVKITNG